MKHKLGFSLLLLLSLEVFSSEWLVEPLTLNGAMQCTVKSQTVMEIKDGVPKEYSSYTDSFKIGDTLLFQYEYEEYETSEPNIYIKLKDFSRDKTLLTATLRSKDIESAKTDLIVFKSASGARSYSFGKNYIRLKDSILAPVLVLSRYYKGDWNGMANLFFGPNLTAHTYTIDCKHGADYVDEIVSKLFEKSKMKKREN